MSFFGRSQRPHPRDHPTRREAPGVSSFDLYDDTFRPPYEHPSGPTATEPSRGGPSRHQPGQTQTPYTPNVSPYGTDDIGSQPFSGPVEPFRSIPDFGAWPRALDDLVPLPPMHHELDPLRPFHSSPLYESLFDTMRGVAATFQRDTENMFAAAAAAAAQAANPGAPYPAPPTSYSSFQSSTTVYGPDGVRQESVVTTTGPDGVPSTRRVIREPDGSEHVTVTRDQLPSELDPAANFLTEHPWSFFHPHRPPVVDPFPPLQPFLPRANPPAPSLLPAPPQYDPPQIIELPDTDSSLSRPNSNPGNRVGTEAFASPTDDSIPGPQRIRPADYLPPRWRR